jgi:hypothetical protein
MHCSYHAALRIGPPRRSVIVHEIAGGPVHQLEFARRTDFADFARGTTRGNGIPFKIVMRSFHGSASGVVRLTVCLDDPAHVHWKVVPTTERELEPRVRATPEHEALSGRIAW